MEENGIGVIGTALIGNSHSIDYAALESVFGGRLTNSLTP
jgi:hypothetical protein